MHLISWDVNNAVTFYLFLKCLFVLRKSKHKLGRGRGKKRQRERERISQVGSMLNVEHEARLGVTSMRSWCKLKSRVKCLTDNESLYMFMLLFGSMSIHVNYESKLIYLLLFLKYSGENWLTELVIVCWFSIYQLPNVSFLHIVIIIILILYNNRTLGIKLSNCLIFNKLRSKKAIKV